MNAVYIDAIGLAAPGLASWSEAQPILRGEQAYSPAPLSNYAPTLLPANEQRRATITVRLAFRVGEEAVRTSGYDASKLATVFASSDADMTVSHRICSALAATQRLVSPTDFHNSVHNAPSGYWHIGARSHLPSSAVAGHDFSFAVGLLEATTQTLCEMQSTLLVCYDAPAPEPMLAKRPLDNPFAVAMLLSPSQSPKSIAALTVETAQSRETDTRMNGAWEKLRGSNPAARSLPLLEYLARGVNGTVHLLRGVDRTLSVRLNALQ
jgi:hypothetical protein